MKAPPFTKANAAEMARRSHASYKARRERERQIIAQFGAPAPDEKRETTTKAQLDAIDERLNSAIARGHLLLVDKLADIKRKLWPLAQATHGAQRPRSKPARPSAPVAS